MECVRHAALLSCFWYSPDSRVLAEKLVWWLSRLLSVIRSGDDKCCHLAATTLPSFLLRKRLQICVSVYFCVSISLKLKTFNGIVIYKYILMAYWQSINFPGVCEGLKRAATSRN